MFLDRVPLLFAPRSSRPLAAQVAERLGTELSVLDERVFETGEIAPTPLTPVQGRDVAVIHSLAPSPLQSTHDKLCELAFIVGACKDAGASRVSVVAPFLSYGRKDRRARPQEPLTNRYIANFLESVGTNRVITLDAHNVAAFENAWRIPVIHIDSAPALAEFLAPLANRGEISIVSPDLGGVKRAELLRIALEKEGIVTPEVSFLVKHRQIAIRGDSRLVGDVSGRIAVIVDDMICSGSTAARAVVACAAGGASEIHLAAAHGVFTEGISARLSDTALTRIIISSSCDPFRLRGTRLMTKLEILDVSDLIAQRLINPRSFAVPKRRDTVRV